MKSIFEVKKENSPLDIIQEIMEKYEYSKEDTRLFGRSCIPILSRIRSNVGYTFDDEEISKALNELEKIEKFMAEKKISNNDPEKLNKALEAIRSELNSAEKKPSQQSTR